MSLFGTRYIQNRYYFLDRHTKNQTATLEIDQPRTKLDYIIEIIRQNICYKHRESLDWHLSSQKYCTGISLPAGSGRMYLFLPRRGSLRSIEGKVAVVLLSSAPWVTAFQGEVTDAMHLSLLGHCFEMHIVSN